MAVLPPSAKNKIHVLALLRQLISASSTPPLRDIGISEGPSKIQKVSGNVVSMTYSPQTTFQSWAYIAVEPRIPCSIEIMRH